ncbi:hypothetical protein PG985_011210 [Apiospora marii]|uniref:uncharacterized protein n=1 Tax=Apiospora marii TaxID=335849 RepID=UPI00312DB863
MENRHMSANPRPFANSKARRAEKDVPEWKAAPKRSNGKKDACITVRARDSPPRQQQLPEPHKGAKSSPTTPSRRGSRLRSPSLPAISEVNHHCHYSNDDSPKTACPSITTTPRSKTIMTSNVSELAAVQALRESNEALLALATELIRMIPASFPVHEMIQRREEARALADKFLSSTAVIEMGHRGYDLEATGTTLSSLPLLKGDAGRIAGEPECAKVHHPRSKSSVF